MKYVFVLILFVISGGLVASILDTNMYHRDLGCDAHTGRAKEICIDLAHEMEWTWLGHAIVAPGWRVTFVTIGRVYCKDSLSLKDIDTLKYLAGHRPFKTDDARLEQGILGLLALLRSRPETKASGIMDSIFDVARTEAYTIDGTSLFNPQNPDYILRDGCPKF
jgi:hypothetical protein